MRERERELEAEIEAVKASAAAERERAAADAQRDLAEARAELEALRAEIRQARGGSGGTSRSATGGSAPPRSGPRASSVRSGSSTNRCRSQARSQPVTRSRRRSSASTARSLAIEGDDAEVVGASGQRIRIPLARLRPSRQREPEAEQPVKVVAMASGDVSDELDVRGQRAQEAREAVRSFVDDAALAGLPSVRVIHGRGTGSVRAAVRDELDGHPLVDRRESDSADGATVAHLDA